MVSLIDTLRQAGQLSENDRVMEFGSGRGTATLHFASSGVTKAAGIEATQHLHDAAQGLLNLNPHLNNAALFHGDPRTIWDLGATTVLYAYDRYFPHQMLQHMSILISTSTALRILISAHQLEGSSGLISRYGMPLRLLATESALDLQNGDTSTVYIYEVCLLYTSPSPRDA